MVLLICTKIQKQVENIIYERVDCKTLHKNFSFYGNLIRECFNEKFFETKSIWFFCIRYIKYTDKNVRCIFSNTNLLAN